MQIQGVIFKFLQNLPISKTVCTKISKYFFAADFVCLVDNQITRNTPILTRVISNTQLASHFQCHYSRYL